MGRAGGALAGGQAAGENWALRALGGGRLEARRSFPTTAPRIYLAGVPAGEVAVNWIGSLQRLKRPALSFRRTRTR